MPRFLSPEWLAALARAAAAAELPAGNGSAVTVGHVVTGGPAGTVSWWVRVAAGRAEAAAGEAPDAAVTFSSDYDTAAALARGDLAVPQAILAGRLRVAGDPAALVRHSGALAALQAALAPLRGATEWG